MNGIFALDKPAGMSSADALDRCKRIFVEHCGKGIKLGHAGTLDPMATGVLLVLLGEATKLQAYLMDGGKQYVAEICFGVETDTLDADGKVTRTAPSDGVTEASLRAALPSQIGTIQQVPPVYSALHVDGERSYDLARAGKAVALPPRPVTIDRITLDAFTPGEQPRATITIDCGKGTYVRSIARDLAAALGTVGHLTALRRTKLGRFAITSAILPDAVSPAVVDTGLLAALPDATLVEISEEAETWVRHGKSENVRTRVTTAAAPGALVRLGRDGRLVALAEQTANGLRLLRVFS